MLHRIRGVVAVDCLDNGIGRATCTNRASRLVAQRVMTMKLGEIRTEA